MLSTEPPATSRFIAVPLINHTGRLVWGISIQATLPTCHKGPCVADSGPPSIQQQAGHLKLDCTKERLRQMM